MRKKVRKLRKTIHIVGEGHDEHAFIKYLKSIYAGQELQISTSNAKGKGPTHIIQFAISKQKHIGYDLIATLLDTDIEWPQKDEKEAKEHNVILLGSSPMCLEGMLLELLGEKIPRTSTECKNQLGPLLSHKSTEPRSYSGLFPATLLNQKRKMCPTLDKLIHIMEKGL